MKVMILAGGHGTRLSEETVLKPKPMVEIGGKPILWHIMKIYSHFGYNEFIILLGYKGDVIKKYFMDYFLHQSDLTIDLSSNVIKYHNSESEPWKVTLLDTGLDTMTGGRILRAKKFVEGETFMLTYGDGVADIDIGKLVEFHHSHGQTVTVSSIQPENRFGVIEADSTGRISKFTEKPRDDMPWVSAGFFVCGQGVFEYLREGDSTIFEKAPLQDLAADGRFFSYRHTGFWKCMDTIRDSQLLNSLWDSGKADWKIWN